MTYRETFDFRAAPEKVFDALVGEPTLGRWLSEGTRVDPVKGGVYRFWGKDVLWCESEDETEGEILELERPSSLAFSWRWKGHHTRVSFRLSAVDGGTQLSIEHRFETFDAGSDGPGPDMAGCHWRIAMGNLVSVLAGGEASLRPDYTAVGSGAEQGLELEIDIDAAPERVFRALLDPDQVRVWMQAEAPEIDSEKGRYSYGWKRGDPPREVGPVRLIELVPNRLLVHDWQWSGESSSQVRWELSPCDSGTRLRLIHTETTDRTHALGWSDALISIGRLVEEDNVHP